MYFYNSDQELIRFFQFVKRTQTTAISIKKAASVVGLQPKSKEWVVSKDIYLDEYGSQVSKENSAYIWSFECLASKCDKVSPTELIPDVVKHLDTQSWSNLCVF